MIERRRDEIFLLIYPPIRGDGGMSALTSKRFEPAKRNKDGWRYVEHRFPIKGGISELDLMVANLQDKRPL